MPDDIDNEEIQLIEGQLVDIDFEMSNLTGIPDDQFTPLGDQWEDDFRFQPDDVGGPPASQSPPMVPTDPKSV
jgi:hypothetical protein